MFIMWSCSRWKCSISISRNSTLHAADSFLCTGDLIFIHWPASGWPQFVYPLNPKLTCIWCLAGVNFGPCRQVMERMGLLRSDLQCFCLSKYLFVVSTCFFCSSSWDEHVFELVLPKACMVGHVDFKFVLNANIVNIPQIQVTLLKNKAPGLGKVSGEEGALRFFL